MVVKHRVAIVTRTKNRPVMLRRALGCVLAQSFRDLVWVVVNDGGDRTQVDEVVAFASGIDAVVVHHDVSLGMEAASNAGIAASESEFIVILDDDDTWEPEFLSKTTAFLDENDWCMGVATASTVVEEKVRDDGVIVQTKRFPWVPMDSKPQVGAVQMADMLRINQIIPNSFVYRRIVLDVIGNYNETYPVLGDWDFNLRFLRLFEIGFISERLSNYHHRVGASQSSPFGNSIHAGVEKHGRQEALIRNAFFRKDVDAGRPGLGFALVAARIETGQIGTLRKIKIAIFRFLHIDR